jgi:hypothetical protein
VRAAVPPLASSRYRAGRLAASDSASSTTSRARPGVSLAELYEGRISLRRKADAAGVRSFHVKAVQAGGPGGVLVCGSAATVRDWFVSYAAERNVNYIVINVPSGDMAGPRRIRTLDAFIAEVVPAVRPL